MSEPTAILFPGQGSHTDEMRERVERVEPGLAELALRAVGNDPFARAGEGTRYAQPAIICASLAAWAEAGRPAAAVFAGHSLGELTALVAAGALEPADGVRLAVIRGRLMDRAAEREPGGMLALLCGLEEAGALALEAGATVANDNAPAQVVLAGPPAVLELAAAAADERGIRSISLAVGGAFHSPAMRPAVAPFRAALERFELRAPHTPVISATTLAEHREPERIRAALAEAVLAPVRWRETLGELERRGIRRYRESGPGKALTGMVRRTLGGVDAAPLATEAAHA